MSIGPACGLGLVFLLEPIVKRIYDRQSSCVMSHSMENGPDSLPTCSLVPKNRPSRGPCVLIRFIHGWALNSSTAPWKLGGHLCQVTT